MSIPIHKVSDLKPAYSSEQVTEWQPTNWCQRYRYERSRGAVGQETMPGSGEYEWHKLAKNDLTHAKRKVFELIQLINEEYL